MTNSSVWVGSKQSELETRVLRASLPDSLHSRDPLPVERFALQTEAVCKQFVKLQVESWRGVHRTGGLQYFSIFNPTAEMKAGCQLSCAAPVTVVEEERFGEEQSAVNVLSRSVKEEKGNYWLGVTNKASYFILDLGCSRSFAAVELVNTHSRWLRDFNTKDFRLAVQKDDIS